MSDGGWGVEGDTPPGDGWWRASDGKWYPPESAPGAADAAAAQPGPEPTAAMPPVTPPAGEPTAAQPAVAPPPTGGEGGGSGVNPVLVGVIALIAVGAVVAILVLVLSGGDDDGDVTADGTSTPTPEASPAPSATEEATPTAESTPTSTVEPTPTATPSPTSTVEPTPTAEPTPAPVSDSCRYLGIDSFGDMQVSVELTSPITAETLVVGYALFDSDDRLLVGSDLFVDLVTEGEMLSVPVDTFTPAPEGVGVGDIRCELGPVESAVPFFTVLPPSPVGGCTVPGLDEFGDVAIAIEFRSTATAALDATVITALYLDGARFATIPTFVDRLQPDELVRLEVETFEALPAGVDVADVSCSLLGVADDDFVQEWSAPVPSDVCIVTGVDDFGDVQVELVVTNPYPEPIELDVFYAIRDPDGARIIATFALTPSAEIGETLVVPHDSFTSLPPGLTPLDTTCEILGVLRF